MTTQQHWYFWIDRGGTFTDIVARDPDGRLLTHKLLSEHPERYANSALQGIREVLGLAAEAPIPSADIAEIRMGTTIGTNALLERKGAAVVLAITAGLADALQIGYQNRPDLFARAIQLPKPLYQQVVEIHGRLSASGEVLQPLRREQAYSDLKAAYERGCRAIAIVLMHGYRYPAHEKAVAEMAHEIGFNQVSTSHQVSPLMKLVARGDTTVVDAYLSPVLRRYVQQVSAELPNTRLFLMQSNGGLMDAHRFQGRDSILSGPAGGIVGAVETTQAAGFQALIGFDMGGTSTDVSHFNGEYERTLETQVAGVRLRVPMMLIHTVAAGGGSICHFDGLRYRVGPDSAGASPGPACYRRGGPLTVTDCNVMLGNIQPQFFPHVFGPNADQALDEAIVRRQFSQLAQHIQATSGTTVSPESIAEGFLRIAVDNMANAIRHISTQRGYNVTQYALCCFGGAGGQHVCAVADALGMQTIVIHPYAGVLSAYGMGLADIRVLREQSIEAPLTAEQVELLNSRFQHLSTKAIAEVRAQHSNEVFNIQEQRRVHLRYDGTDTTLSLAFASFDALQANFTAQHQQRYGFVMADRALVIAAMTVEVIGCTDVAHEHSVTEEAATTTAEAVSATRFFCQGEWQKAPVYHREQLRYGHRIDGPALIIEHTGTNVLAPGWQAQVNALNHLILQRVVPLPRQVALGTAVDPVMLEIFNNLFMSIAEQMGITLRNTAYSVNIKERLDFSCALFNAEGELIANAPHVPVHLGSMGQSVRAVLQSQTVQRGEVFLLNSPYDGGTHLPDLTVITPVFLAHDTTPRFWVASRAHHADIGGITPGSVPPTSTHIEQEGVFIRCFRLVSQGRLQEAALLDLLTDTPYPARSPAQNIADLQAQIAANEQGAQALLRCVEVYSPAVVQAYMQHVKDNAEESVRRVLADLRLSEGDCGRFCYPMDDGNQVQVSITVDRATRSALIDFTGTSPQHAGNWNAPKAISIAAVLYVFRTLVDDPIPLNEGCLKPLTIHIPAGCLLDPKPPAAVVAGNVETSQVITDALYGALGIMAASQGTMNNVTFGNDRYQYYETICGGAGAGDGFHGASAVHTHMTNSRLTDPEVLEWRYPVLVECFSRRPGSGGAGRWHGGEGVIRRLKFREPMTAGLITGHRRVPPYGLNGGAAGQVGKNYLIRAEGQREELAAVATVTVNADDALIIETPGGGGFGEP